MCSFFLPLLWGTLIARQSGRADFVLLSVVSLGLLIFSFPHGARGYFQ